MFEYDIKYVEKPEYKNLVLSKQMEVGNLHIFLILDTLDEKIADLLLNKIIDFLVEGLKEKDVYNSFSEVLEKINNFLKEILSSGDEEGVEKINKTSLLVGVLDTSGNLHFSKTGKASSYLIRNLNEISEITDKKSNFENFTFVSSGKIESGDLVFFSNKRLLNYLAKSDLLDVWKAKNMKKENEGLVNILSTENIKSNISFLSLKFDLKEDVTKEDNESFLGFLFKKSKKIIRKPKKNLKETCTKIIEENKIFKNIFLILGIILSIFLLYFIIGTVLDKGTSNSKVQIVDNKIKQAEEYLKIAINASEDKDKENFNLNIHKADKIALELKETKILKDDIKKLLEKISNVKKEFNNVKIFEETDENLVTLTNEKNVVKIIENRNNIYVIGEDKIIGPIIQGKTPKRNIFSNLSKGDKIIDAVSVGDNIIILTKNSNIVKFNRNNKFSYLNVIGQKKWEEAKAIEKFGTKIYLLGKNNQIYKHRSAGSNSYTAGESFLSKENVLQLGNIFAFGIDGGIFILKENLKLKHAFKKDNIIDDIELTKDLEAKNTDSDIKILIPEKSKFLFFYFNNKIWIYKPDSASYKNIKKLEFIGQIEAEKFAIKSFIVKGNSEILILNENGVYRLSYRVKEKDDGKKDLILR